MAADAPAWSWAFLPESLQAVRPAIPSVVTRDWAWDGATGAGIRVAVVDSGVEATHPALGRGVDGYVTFSLADDGLHEDATAHEDTFGHGTACAGIIRNIAPDCEIYSVRVLGPGLSGKGEVLVRALEWCVTNGIHVANLSLGTNRRDMRAALHDMADRAYFAGTMLVTAANNLPIPTYPSLYASVISVASSEGTEGLGYYANPQPPVEFGAPGIEVRVPWLNGGYVTATGNSYAAPHISGLIALILSKHPGTTVPEMKTILRALAVNASALDGSIAQRGHALPDVEG